MEKNGTKYKQALAFGLPFRLLNSHGGNLKQILQNSLASVCTESIRESLCSRETYTIKNSKKKFVILARNIGSEIFQL